MFILLVVVVAASLVVAEEGLRTYACHGPDSGTNLTFNEWKPVPCDVPVYVWLRNARSDMHDWVPAAAYDEWQQWETAIKQSPTWNASVPVQVALKVDARPLHMWHEVMTLCEVKAGLDCMLDPLLTRLLELAVFKEYCTWCVASQGTEEDPDCNVLGCKPILTQFVDVLRQIGEPDRTVYVTIAKHSTTAK